MSTRRRTAGVYASPAPKGPNGERLCRNCRRVMPKDARHNCSPECSEQWRAKTSPGYMRSVIFERDKGICARCSTDTQKNRAEYFARRRLLNEGIGKHGYPLDAITRLNDEYGMPAGKISGNWWEADHIVPVVEGGGECGPEGYRTLCVPCHRSETAELARRLAQGRKRDKIAKRDQARGLLEGIGSIDIQNANEI